MRSVSGSLLVLTLTTFALPALGQPDPTEPPIPAPVDENPADSGDPTPPPTAADPVPEASTPASLPPAATPPSPPPPSPTPALPSTLAPPPDKSEPEANIQLSGFQGGRFFLRNARDDFRVYVGARLHLDSYNYFGPGVSDTTLSPTFLLRRARVEIGGQVLGKVQWLAQIESAPTGLENRAGTNQSYAAPAGTDPTATTAQYAAVQTPSYKAQPVQVYANYQVANELNLLVGQANMPFTMENQTSTNTGTFLERSLAVRAWGVPEVRDPGLSVWGRFGKRTVGYAVGLYNGDGYNRLNADNRFKIAGRFYVRPLAAGEGALSELQVGASIKHASFDSNKVAYDVPSLTTQSGYAFWSPIYNDSLARRTHIIPSGREIGYAGELRLPIGPVDIRSEFVYLSTHTREGVDGYQVAHTERRGEMKGYGYYAQISYWLLGSTKMLGDPGESGPPKLDLKKADPEEVPHGVELAAKWEQLNLSYESASRSGGDPDAKNVDGDIRVNAFTAAVNYWASRHLRVSLNYTLNSFPDSAPKKATTSGGPAWSSSQRALAPGNTLPVGVDDSARDSAHSLHEVSARLGIAF